MTRFQLGNTFVDSHERWCVRLFGQIEHRLVAQCTLEILKPNQSEADPDGFIRAIHRLGIDRAEPFGQADPVYGTDLIEDGDRSN
jgi:hypothetical protein